MVRMMSFSDRQMFVQSLMECRNLAIACGVGEGRDSPLRENCRKLIGTIDLTMVELVGDAAFDHLRDASA